MDDELVILCPRCHELVFASYDEYKLKLSNKCSCVKEEELSEEEWYELIYRLWDDFSVLNIPEEIEMEELQDE